MHIDFEGGRERGGGCSQKNSLTRLANSPPPLLGLEFCGAETDEF
jgi:hypothetical protein